VIDTHRLRSFDGTQIAYHVAGTPGAPAVVIANGLGGPFAAWRGLVDYLGDRYRFVCHDYRGLHASERPASDAAYTVADHARDLEAVVERERIDRAAFLGWSLGVEVLLEAFPRLRPRVHDLVLVGGGWGGVRGAIGGLPVSALPRVAKLLARVPARRVPAGWIRRLCGVGDTVDDATLADLSRAFAEIDLDAWARSLAAAGRHDARGVLPAVDVPALVIAGDRDPFAPRGLAQQMARTIPDAEILVVPGGSHYAALEHPELVILRIERFWRDRGW
jgi:pimeloyl-ACP methyl ester carboxylesterase